MHGIAQAGEAVVSIKIAGAGVGKNAVAAFGNVVIRHLRTGRVPHGYAVAALIHAQLGIAHDAVAAHARIGRAVDIHAHGIFQNLIVCHLRAQGGLGEKHARIHGRQAQARAGDGEAAQNHIGRAHFNGAPRARALDFGNTAFGAFDGERLIDDDLPPILPRRQAQSVARVCACNRLLQIAARGHLDGGGIGALHAGKAAGQTQGFFQVRKHI